MRAIVLLRFELGPCRKVKAVSSFQPIVPGTIATDVVVDCNSASADYLKDVLPYQKRCIVVDSDAEDMRMRIDNVHQLRVPLADVKCGLIATFIMKPNPVVFPGAINNGLFGQPRSVNEPCMIAPAELPKTTPRWRSIFNVVCVRVPRYTSARRPEFQGAKYTPVAELIGATKASVFAIPRSRVNDLDAIDAEPALQIFVIQAPFVPIPRPIRIENNFVGPKRIEEGALRLPLFAPVDHQRVRRSVAQPALLYHLHPP